MSGSESLCESGSCFLFFSSSCHGGGVLTESVVTKEEEFMLRVGPAAIGLADGGCLHALSNNYNHHLRN